MRRIPLFAALAISGAAQQPPDNAGQVDRYLTQLAVRLLRERSAAVAAIRTPDQVHQRQDYIRRKMVEEIGGLPAEKTPLHSRITGVLERDGYRVEKLIYESLPGFFVTANVYVPSRGARPFPAVLGVAGHSNNGKASALYQSAWISMARRGMLVLAYDPPGQGERLEYYDPAAERSTVGVGTREHMMAGMQCLLTGTNIARYEIWDGIRGFDYLLTRGDVDPKRIAVAGNSGGGTQSAYLAFAEPRLAVAAPSCYITSWEKLWGQPGPQDAEQIFAGFLADGFDFGDFLIAFAPRPLKVLTAIRDFFPIDGARATFAEVKRIYEMLEAGDHISFFEYDDGHGWSKPRRESTYQWMDKWLLGRETDGGEGPLKLETDEDLDATPTGQVATSFGGETVQSLNQRLAESLARERAAAGPKSAEALRALVARRLHVPSERGVPPAQTLDSSSGNGLRIERIAIESEAGIRLQARVFVPPGGAARKPAVIWLNPTGPAADAESMAAAGQVVMSLDVRGWGEGGSSSASSGYSQSWQTAMRAMLVSKTMAGSQTYDVLRAFDYLAARADVASDRIGVWGRGNGGALALYAAVLEPRIRKIAMEGSIPSLLSVCRARIHEGMVDMIVPGVLKDFDLPELAAAVAPRMVLIASPRTPAGGRLPLAEAARDYPRAMVRGRVEGQAAAEFASFWLNK